MYGHSNSAADKVRRMYIHHIVLSLQGRQEVYYENIEVFLYSFNICRKFGRQ